MWHALTTRTTVANLAGAGAGTLLVLAGLVANPPAPGRVDPCGGAMLEVVSSTEPGKFSVDPQGQLTGVVHDVAALFGACIKVRAVISGFEEQALETEWAGHAGQDTPDVWLPAESLWLSLLKRRLPDDVPKPTRLPDIASSSMVLAIDPATAQELGWSEKNPPTWEMVRQATRSGRLRLLKENATNSSSGALATLLAFRAGAGGQELTPELVAQGPAYAFATDVEHAVVRYPTDNLEILQELAAGNSQVLRGASALFIENAFVAQFPEVGHRMQVLPIRGETARFEHPFVLRPGLDPATMRLARRFNAALCSQDGRARFRAQHYDEPVAPAGDQSFRDGEVVHAALGTWAGQLRRRVRMLLLLDESGSLKNSIGQIQRALDPALRRLSPTDHVAVAGFPADDGHVIDPLTETDGRSSGLSFHSPIAVAESLSRLRARIVATRPASPIVEAVDEARDQLVAGARIPDPDNPVVNVIVVLTDGRQDPPSEERQQAVQARLSRWRDQVHVYVIPVGAPAPLGMVQAMAAASNGEVLCVDSRPGCPHVPYTGFDAVFEAIVVGLGGNALT
jgi:hypothetical protein